MYQVQSASTQNNRVSSRIDQQSTPYWYCDRSSKSQAIEFNRLAFLCFVDLTQAFVRVQLKDGLRILQEQGVNNNIIQVIKQLNPNNSTRIQSGTSNTEEVPISIGIRQEDSLSTLLFNLVMGRMINQEQNVRTDRMQNSVLRR